MDPKACLVRAIDAVESGDLDECRDALRDYRAWRNGGGFQPANGDTVASEIRYAMAAHASVRGEAWRAALDSAQYPTCPVCGACGPHDDNGATGAARAFCCRACGEQWDAVSA